MGENQYASMLGVGAPSPQAAQFGPMVQGGAPDPGVAKPAANPEEVEQRKAGWREVLANPNFTRALGFMGAHLMQPVPVGQSPLGHIGQGLNTGMTAMQMGEYSQYEQDQKKAHEARLGAESTANIEGTQARTASEIARTPGVAAESQIAVDTAAARTSSAQTAAEQAKINLAKATDDAAITKVENELRKRRAEIERSIPDETLRKAEMAKMDAAILSVDEARARIKASTASTAASEGLTAERKVETESKQLTLDTLKTMAPDEQKQFLTKTGKYSQHTSGIGQQAVMWGDIYDKLPATDAAKAGKTREQFQMDRLTSSKAKDAADTLTKYMSAGGDDPEVIQGLTDLVKEGIKAKKGAPTTPVGSKTPGGLEKVTNAADYQALKSGTRYIDPKGVERVKQ